MQYIKNLHSYNLGKLLGVWIWRLTIPQILKKTIYVNVSAKSVSTFMIKKIFLIIRRNACIHIVNYKY